MRRRTRTTKFFFLVLFVKIHKRHNTHNAHGRFAAAPRTLVPQTSGKTTDGNTEQGNQVRIGNLIRAYLLVNYPSQRAVSHGTKGGLCFACNLQREHHPELAFSRYVCPTCRLCLFVGKSAVGKWNGDFCAGKSLRPY